MSIESIKIYLADLKPKKQRELLPKLREFFEPDEIPSPLIEFTQEIEPFVDFKPDFPLDD